MGANIGCYVNVGIGEVESIKLLNRVNKLGIVGCSKAMLANRISFALNLTGRYIYAKLNYCAGFHL